MSEAQEHEPGKTQYWLFLCVRWDDPVGMDGYVDIFGTFDEAAAYSFTQPAGYFHEAQIVEVNHNAPGREWRRAADEAEFKINGEDFPHEP